MPSEPVRADSARQQLPLWQLLQATAQLVQAVRRGASATPLLAELQSDLRPGVQALAYQVWRQLGRAEALRALLVSRQPPPQIDALLCTALALSWNETQAPYDPHTLVNQAVEAAKKSPAMKGQSGFINACLRRFLRERDAMVANTDAQPVARWNHPSWWIERLQQDYPSQWQPMLAANNRPAPMTLRVNLRQGTVQEYQQRLEQAGLISVRNGDYGLALVQACPVERLPGFADGAVSVQDAAAQLAAPLLLQDSGLGLGSRILDACAAPGGKTAHLLELSDAQVIALDIDPQRCARIGQNLERLGLQAKVLAADASSPDAWWDGQKFDAILLDAPCSASGIVRRHPDVRWLRRPSDLAQLARQQSQLLAALWPLLKPGGRLVYCTCSVFHEEGQARIQAFLANNTEARLLPSPGHLQVVFADSGSAVPDNRLIDHDGFYYALVEKRAA